MGNKRSRRSKRLATPSPEREVSETRVDSPETGNKTLTNFNLNVQESLGKPNLENQQKENPVKLVTRYKFGHRLLNEKYRKDREKKKRNG